MEPLVFRPENINRQIEDKVRRVGQFGLSPEELEWYQGMRQREVDARLLGEKRQLDRLKEMVIRNGLSSLKPTQMAMYRRLLRKEVERQEQESSIVQLTPSSSPLMDPEDEARRALNRRLRDTLRRVRSAERRQNRPTMRRGWQNLANIGLEYQRQGRRYSEKVRNLKAELQQEEEAAAPAAPALMPARAVTPAPAPRAAVPIPIVPKKPVLPPAPWYRRYFFKGYTTPPSAPKTPENSWMKVRMIGGRRRTQKKR